MTLAMAGAAPRDPASKVTEAQLVQDLAGAARAAGAVQASAILERVDVGRTPRVPVTEARAAALLRSLGVDVTTSNPGRGLSRQQADALVVKFKGSLPAPVAMQGAASGHQPAPATLDDCFVEKNHGLCVGCCRDMGGSASACAKACQVINKPSESEPLP